MNSLAIEDQLKLLNTLGYTLNIDERYSNGINQNEIKVSTY